MFLKAIIFFTKFFFVMTFSTFAFAAEPLPRGSDVGAVAGYCSVGPFGQIKDAGPYEKLCNQLTSAEICFAYIKLFIANNGDVQVADDTAKATFCTGLLSRQLHPNSGNF